MWQYGIAQYLLIFQYMNIDRMNFYLQKWKDWVRNPNSKVSAIHQVVLFLYFLRTDKDLENIYKHFSLYNQSTDEHAKTQLRFEIEEIHNLIHKSNIYALLKSVKQKQLRLSQIANQCNTNQKSLKFQHELALSISDLYNQSMNPPNVLKFKCQDNLLESILINLHNTNVKYKCIWKVITGFSKKQKRSFLLNLGQNSKFFQSQQIVTLQKFSKQILSDGVLSKISNISFGGKQLSSEFNQIQNILTRIQMAEDAQTLSGEIKDDMKKINNYYMLRRFINNIKQMKKVQCILYEIKIQLDKQSGSIENIISRIKSDTILQNKLKNILQALTKQLFQYRKSQFAFKLFKINMNDENINMLFNYLNEMTKLLKAAMRQFNIKLQNKQKKEEFTLIQNENLFQLSQYFEKLIDFIKESRIFPEKNNQSKMQQIDGQVIAQNFIRNINQTYQGNKKIDIPNITDITENIRNVIEQKDLIARKLHEQIEYKNGIIQMLQKRITQQNKLIEKYKSESNIQKQNKSKADSDDSYKSMTEQKEQQIELEKEQNKQVNCKEQIKQNKNIQTNIKYDEQIKQAQIKQKNELPSNTMQVDLKVEQGLEPQYEQQSINEAIQNTVHRNHQAQINQNESQYRKNSCYNSLQYNSTQYKEFKQYWNYDYNRISGQSMENMYSKQIKQLQQNQQKLNVKLKQQQEDMFVMSQQRQSLINKCNTYEHQLESSAKYVAFLESKVNKLEQFKKQMSNKIGQTQSKMANDQAKTIQKIDQSCNTQIVEELKQLNIEKIPSYQNQISAQSQQYTTFLQQKITKLQQQNGSLMGKIASLSKKAQKIDRQCNTEQTERNKEIVCINKAQENGQIQIKQRYYYTYFYGRIFNQLCTQQEQNLKFELIKNIQAMTGKTIRRTIKLYETDKKNKLSPHEYMDNYSNWVALFRLKNGEIVGAFSQLALSPKNHKQQSGYKALLFNLNKHLYYRQVTRKQATKIYQYEQYYLVIGNSQIRYNFQSYQLQHNFGNTYRYFDTGKDNGVMFYGVKESAMDIDMFQFYHLIAQ